MTDRNIEPERIADLVQGFEQIQAEAHAVHERWKTTQTEYLAGKVDGLDCAALILGRLIDQRTSMLRIDGSLIDGVPS